MGIRCEVCGNEHIIKQDAVFVCQNCGIQYSLSEIKQLLVNSETKDAVNTDSLPDKKTKAVKEKKKKEIKDPVYFRNNNLGTRHITTKDLIIGKAKDVLSKYRAADYSKDPAHEFYVDNTAAVLYEKNTYVCGAHNYIRTTPSYTGEVSKNTPVAEKSVKGIRYYPD